ncbi:MAG: hypothetical protein WBF58_22870 [Xanthobacteraceae bacterium]
MAAAALGELSPRAATALATDSATDLPIALADDVADLASTIDRIAALIASPSESPVNVVADALERIGDIAFVLHERDVEASLCDALDAAVREIGECEALREADVQRSREAAALLRELSHRVSAMADRLRAQQSPAVKPQISGELSGGVRPVLVPPAPPGEAKAAASALPRAHTAAPARPAIGARASDPFAPLGELSEEETIALFS